MCDELPKQCPAWCAGGHDDVGPDDAFLHTSEPQFVMLADETLCVHIESFMESRAEDPPPGRITWEHGGTLGPGMTAGEGRVFIAVVARLIDQLERAERAR
jgi:hypothetical protein